MSANLDLVRSIYADWERGDFSSAEWAHPEIEYVVADGPTPGSWSGPARMERAWRDALSAWQDWRIEADDYRELDDQRVLVLIHRSGHGKTSGLGLGPSLTKGANVFQIREGRVTRLVNYYDRGCALAELGLSG